jgi:hypothetical protein
MMTSLWSPVLAASGSLHRPSLRKKFVSQPALIEVGVVTEGGEAAGFSVSVPARKLDSFFNVALVFDL